MSNLEQKLDNIHRWCWEMAKSLMMILAGLLIFWIWISCR